MNKWEEAEHPRDGDGQFTDKYGEEYRQNDKRNYEKVLTNERRQSNIPSYPNTNGFRNNSDRKNHEHHLKEFGFKKFKFYEEEAIYFANNEEDGCEVFESENNRWYKYQESTNRLCIVGDDGNLITYFKPKLKRKYYDSEKKKGEKKDV